MQRFACALIGSALIVITALVGLLLSDALAPGRVPPMLAFWAACGSGLLLIGGLVLLERGSAAADPLRRSPALRSTGLGSTGLHGRDLRVNGLG